MLVGARTIGLIAILLVGPLAAFGAEPSRPASPDCPNTAWNLNQEVALFKGAATSTPAGLAVADAPRLELGKLYQVSLTPVDRVTFAASAKPSQRHDASAGILAVEIPTSGNYRVSMDGPFWVEAVGPDGPIASTGFQGRQVCSMIHKIVEFPLLPGHTTLQISGASSTVKLAVTPSANAGERGASR